MTPETVSALIEDAERQVAEEPEARAAIYNDLGVALIDGGANHDAEQALRKALSVDPGYALAHGNLANALHLQGDYVAADSSYRTALELQPEMKAFYNGMGTNLDKLGFPRSAIVCLTEFLNAGLGDADTLIAMGQLHQRLGEVDRAIACFAQAHDMSPGTVKGLSTILFTQNSANVMSDAEVEIVAHKFADATRAKVTIPPFDFSHLEGAPKTLNVGFVSADFCAHSVTQFLSCVFDALDPYRVAIHVYSNGTAEDDITHRLRMRARVWRQIDQLDGDAAARLIHQDNIHILFDLSGHTAKKRLDIFVRKPAPVQVSWIGYLGTTGLVEMDYVLTSEHCMPSDQHGYYVETPWRMQRSFMCYTPPETEVAILPPPSLERGHVTFGCYVSHMRYTEEAIRSWARILNRVPNARMILRSMHLDEPEVTESFATRFADHGLDPSRVDFEGGVSREDFMRSFNEVDLLLDTFPGNGLTTMFEACWMGTPVITALEHRAPSRAASGVLKDLGYHELVASSEAEYVELGVALANDPDRLAHYNRTMRDHFLSSTLCDAEAFCRQLEHILGMMWGAYVETARGPDR